MFNINEIGLKSSLAQNISGLIENDRLPHAIMLRGGSAQQRNKLSMFLSEAFVCVSDNKPCGKCSHCLKAYSGNHPDIVVVDPALQNEKIFKINLIREMKDDAYIIPNEASKKVYILKMADKMNNQAQNALLKLIEEPPSYARFILECETSAAILETIMSRVTVFDLGADVYDISDDLKQKADETAAKLAEALLKPTECEFLKITAEFEKDKTLFEPTLPALQLIFRDAVVIKAGSNITLSEHSEISRQMASKLTMISLMSLTEKIDELKKDISRNANKNLLITRFSAVMRETAYKRS